MIATLSGSVSEKLDNAVVVDCQGVGYGLLVSNGTSGQLALGEPVKLYVYEHIREEAHDLYGFASPADKQFFEKLIGVNGVGPKMALSIMNLGTSEELGQAIGSGNVAFITRASGVGRRLAERIMVDLKDSFAEAALLQNVSQATGSSDALSALVALGYSQPQALEALSSVATADSIEEQVRQALKVLAR